MVMMGGEFVMEIIIACCVVAVVAAACYIHNKKSEDKGEDDMPMGLQVYDANNNCVLDFTTETYHMFGSATISGGVAGSVSDSRIKVGDTVIFPITQSLHDFDESLFRRNSVNGFKQKRFAVFPNITIANGKISWSFRNKADSYGCYVDMKFVYGGKVR